MYQGVRLLLVFEQKSVWRRRDDVQRSDGVYHRAPVVRHPHCVEGVGEIDDPLGLGEATSLADVWLNQIHRLSQEELFEIEDGFISLPRGDGDVDGAGQLDEALDVVLRQRFLEP